MLSAGTILPCCVEARATQIRVGVGIGWLGPCNKLPQTGVGLTQQKCTVAQTRRLKVRDRDVGSAVPSEASLLGSSVSVFSLCLHVVFLYVCICILISS